jgi:hypothetical protein
MEKRLSMRLVLSWTLLRQLSPACQAALELLSGRSGQVIALAVLQPEQVGPLTEPHFVTLEYRRQVRDRT